MVLSFIDDATTNYLWVGRSWKLIPQLVFDRNDLDAKEQEFVFKFYVAL